MPRYIKKDSELGYVEDSAEIEYLKFNNMRHTILGCMLGDFDDQGRYVVNELIARELIEMRKYIVETLDNVSICLSELKLDKQISFAVTFAADKATLSLIEKLSYEGNYRINSGAYSNINEYILDEIETSGMVDKTIIYKRWNISENGGSVLDVFNMDEETLAQFAGIVNRFKYLMKANEILLNKESDIEAVESQYMIGMLDLVARFPKLKEVVDAKIRQELRDKKNLICVDKPNFVKTLNELVTELVDGNLSLLTPEELSDFNSERHIVLNGYNIRMDSVVDVRSKTEQRNDTQYTKLHLNTNGEELNSSVSDLASAFVRAKQEREVSSRANAVKQHGMPINQYNPNADYSSFSDLLTAYLNARLGVDIRDNLFKPIPVVEKEESETKKEATANKVQNKVKQGGGEQTKDKPKKKGGDNTKKPNKATAKKAPTTNKAPAEKPKLVCTATARREQETAQQNFNATLDSNRTAFVDGKKKIILQKKNGDFDIGVDDREKIAQQKASTNFEVGLDADNTITQNKTNRINIAGQNIQIDDDGISMHRDSEVMETNL